MVQEVTTPIPDVLAWLPRVPPETAAELLVGCGFHDGQSENLDATPIEAVDVGRATVTLAGSDKPVSLRRFPEGEFIDARPGAPLAAAIAASRTPAELRDEIEQRALRRAGFEPGKLPSGEARRAVLAMAELDAVGRTPDGAQRMAFYQAARAGGDAATARSAARLLGNARQRFEAAGQIPEDVAEAGQAERVKADPNLSARLDILISVPAIGEASAPFGPDALTSAEPSSQA